MPATVTNLQDWKASHPPMLKLWNAHCRCVSAWWALYFRAFLG